MDNERGFQNSQADSEVGNNLELNAEEVADMLLAGIADTVPNTVADGVATNTTFGAAGIVANGVANNAAHNGAGDVQQNDNVVVPANPTEADLIAIREAQRELDREYFFQKRTCAFCFEGKELHRLIEMPCVRNHFLCHDCIRASFEHAMISQSSYPPKGCCYTTSGATLRIEDYCFLMTDAFIAKYLHRASEYATDARLRRYCGVESCKTFLPTDTYEAISGHTVADCRECGKTTCILCKQVVPKTTGHTCMPVHHTAETNNDYGSEARWKNCPFCSRPGVLSDACNHVTCDEDEGGCGNEWCFVCLEPWVSGNHSSCQTYNDPVYDNQGYDQYGYHRDTGFDREGYTRAGYNILGLDREGNRLQASTHLPNHHRNDGVAFNDNVGFMGLSTQEIAEAEIAVVIQLLERGEEIPPHLMHIADGTADLQAEDDEGDEDGEENEGYEDFDDDEDEDGDDLEELLSNDRHTYWDEQEELTDDADVEMEDVADIQD